MILCFFLAACGRRGDPLPPGLRLPGPPTALSLSGPGGELTLSWKAPKEDLAGRPLAPLKGYLVLRGAWPPSTAPCETCPEDLMPAATVDIEERRAQRRPETSWADPDAQPGWTYRYRLRALDSRERPGSLSDPATVVWPALGAPSAAAAPGDQQAFLSVAAPAWPPGVEPLGIRVYDRQGRVLVQAKSWAQGVTVPGLRNGVAQELAVRLAVKTREAWDVESPGALVTVTPVDTAPPFPPESAVAIAEPAGVRLHWLPAGEETYAAVTVFRAREGQGFEEIARLPGGAVTYTDAKAAPGLTYLYTVVAEDAAGNRSLPSREARVRVP